MPLFKSMQVGELKPVTFLVTDEIIQGFAGLCGDFSSLHLDAGFAHRSLYHKNVVHGFLPLLGLTALRMGTSPGRVRWERLAANFLKPVFCGDRLEISPCFLQMDAEKVELEFEIRQTESGTVVICGSGTLVETGIPVETSCQVSGPNTGLLRHALAEQNWEFTQISKGAETTFAFVPSVVALRTLFDLLSAGLMSDKMTWEDWLQNGDATLFLPASLFSTMVGMCMPGKRATFLNFEIAVPEPLDSSQPHLIKSVVDFKSNTTSTISQIISITAENQAGVLATGKIHARVNPPPVQMPSIESLRQHDLDLQLTERVVLITGASRGLGETTAKLFALHGARVAVNYLQSRNEAEAVVREIEEQGGKAMSVQADVSDRIQVKDMVRQICARFGTIDILINNAVRDFQPIPFLELTWDKVADDLNVILKGAFNCCQEILPLMASQHSGKIVNLSTVFVENPPVNQSKYVMAKSALVGLTRSLAIEFAHHNIQINLVVPSMMETDSTGHVPKIFVEKMKGETPMQRLASPVDVARAVVFLSSSLASFTTGQKIMVTGGISPLL